MVKAKDVGTIQISDVDLDKLGKLKGPEAVAKVQSLGHLPFGIEYMAVEAKDFKPGVEISEKDIKAMNHGLRYAASPAFREAALAKVGKTDAAGKVKSGKVAKSALI